MNSFNSSNNKNPSDYTKGQYGYPMPSYLDEEKPINWRRFIFIFLRNWYWFLITLGLSLGIAFFKIRYDIPQYQASASIIIENEENSQDLVGQLRSVRSWRRQTDLANETAKLTAFRLINRAVDSLHQDIFWTAHGRIRVRPLYQNPRYNLTIISDSSDWYKEKEWFIDYINETSFRLYKEELLDTILPLDSIISIDGWQFINSLNSYGGHYTYSFVVNDQVALSKRYKKKLLIHTDDAGGNVINLVSIGLVGEREVDFLNEVCQTYIFSELERKQTIAENTFIFIDDQINVILDSLRQAEEQLLTFKLTNNVVNLSREGEMAFDRMRGFHEQKTTLKLKQNYYRYLKNYIEERNNPQTIIAPTLTEEGDQLLIGAVQDLQQLYKDRETLALSVHENSPSLESINSRIQSIRLRIIEIVNGLIENNHLTQKQLDIEEQAIIDQLQTLPLSEQQLLNIKRKYDLYNQFYTFLLQKRAEAGIQKASTISNARILDPARYDNISQIGIDKKVIIILALLLGLALPALILILKDRLDNRIKEREDITSRTNIPIIGIVGHAENVSLFPSSKNSTSPFTESLRRIRTNLSFALREDDKKVIMVTSSISGEGKSFTASNLAAIIALNNKKVLLIGCDMRKPTLHRLFDVSNEIGVTSYIIGQNSIKDITLPTNVENLHIIPAGPVPPNPAELIETNEMNILFENARMEYDYIIIDTPPIALVADALSLALYADLTLYLIRQNHSHKGVLEIANSLMLEDKLPKTYLLINDIKPSNSFGMNYYYGYGKGYIYGYYDYYNTYTAEEK